MKYAQLALILTLVPFVQANENTKTLQNSIKEADRLEIIEYPVTDQKGETPISFSLENREEIGRLISSFEFKDESIGPCACLGDCRIIFYKEKKKLASLSYHHGITLNWSHQSEVFHFDFTPKSEESWRKWFAKNGEPRFQTVYESKLAAEKKKTDDRIAFLELFPEKLRTILAGYEDALDEHYEKNPDEDFIPMENHPVFHRFKKNLLDASTSQELASAISRALGTLNLRQAAGGTWGFRKLEVEFIIETSKSLKREDFVKVVNSSDPATQLGFARLFFYLGYSELFDPIERGKIAVKLIENLATYDRCESHTWLFNWFCDNPSFPVTKTLERIALGDLSFKSNRINLSQNVAFPHLACLLLSKTNSTRFEEALKRVGEIKPEYPDDKLALLVAKAIKSNATSLTKGALESRSTVISLHALYFLERQQTKESLNLIITKGTNHDWARVREESILTIERMTGKTWFKNEEHERAEWHGEKIREWWAKEKEHFTFSD